MENQTVAQAATQVPDNDVDWSDVQGLVLRGYGTLPYALYFLLRIDDVEQAKASFGRIAHDATPATVKPDARALHIALTAAGLRKIGVPEETMRNFSPPFREGMVESHRTRILGDTGPNAPENWRWGSTEENTPHALVMLFAATEADVEAYADELKTPGCSLIGEPLKARNSEDKRDHFHYLDGLAQPRIQGAPGPAGARSGDVAAGEMIIGYQDSRGETATYPQYGKNGTYLVFRQMDQYVGMFYDFLKRHNPEHPEALAAKIVGRWPNGTPVAVAPDAPVEEKGYDLAFDYSDDPYGMKCPVGAHIRRANPRSSLADPDTNAKADRDESLRIVSHHRITRRGRLYGPLWRPTGTPYPEACDDGITRGLHFMCINANIANGFELIQQTWFHNTKFDGLYDEVDPMVGIGQGPNGACDFSIPRLPYRERLKDIDRFIHVRGGAYFFMPGISALKELAALSTG